MDMYIFDGDKREAVTCTDIAAWADFMEHGKRVIGRTTIAGTFVVSTVFLGLDHGFGNGIVLYETLIFYNPSDVERLVSYDETMRRYGTYQGALGGHEEAIQLVLSALEGTDYVIEEDPTTWRYVELVSGQNTFLITKTQQLSLRVV